MAYNPVSGFTLQTIKQNGQTAEGYYLKFYIANTTTALSMATDATGGTLLSECKLNDNGMPISNPLDNSTVFIPHVNQNYRLVIYRNKTDADANDTAAAFVNIPDVSTLASGDVIVTKYDDISELPEVVSGQRVSVTGYHPSTTVGGGEFVGNASARHDGVIYFDPDRSFPTPSEWANGPSDPAVIAWYADSGVDVPCWERVGVEYLTPEMAGAVGDGLVDDTSALQASLNSGYDVYIENTIGVSIDTSSPSISHSNTTYFPWQNTNYCAVEITTANQKVFGSGSISVLSVGAGVTSGYCAIFLVREVAGVDISGISINTNSSTNLNNIAGVLAIGDTDYTNNTHLDGLSISGCIFDGDGSAGQNSSAFSIVVSYKNVTINNNKIIDAGAVCSAHFTTDIHVTGNVCSDILELVDFDKAVKRFTVSGNIVNTLKGGGDAIIELNGSQYGTVSDNILSRDASYNGRGIIVSGKTTFGDQAMPADDQQPHDVLIVGNSLSGFEDGIFCPESDTFPYRIDISHNSISDMQGGSSQAVVIHGSYMTCDCNTISECNAGIVKQENRALTNFSISGNKFQDIGSSEIQLTGDDSPAGKELEIGTVSNNVITSTRTGAVNTDQPILLIEPKSITIVGNNIDSTTDYGVRMSSTSGGTLYNTLTSNIVLNTASTEYRVPASISANLQSAANVGTIA